MASSKSLVLLSGGIDSAVLLWWAKSRGLRLASLSFDFPGRRKGELKAVSRLRALSGCREHFDISLPFLDAPKAEESCRIPQRNLMYYGIAASLAEKIGAELILGGHIRHDGVVFKDASVGFFSRLQRLIQPSRPLRSVGRASLPGRAPKRIRLRFPFITMDKREVVRLGLRLRVPFEATWSCSRDVSAPCGRCGSCAERRSGFAAARVFDPLAT